MFIVCCFRKNEAFSLRLWFQIFTRAWFWLVYVHVVIEVEKISGISGSSEVYRKPNIFDVDCDHFPVRSRLRRMSTVLQRSALAESDGKWRSRMQGVWLQSARYTVLLRSGVVEVYRLRWPLPRLPKEYHRWEVLSVHLFVYLSLSAYV